MGVLYHFVYRLSNADKFAKVIFGDYADSDVDLAEC
jgi:hypothetical protein